MTETSKLWTTGGAGDGSATYTRADWSIIAKIFSSCQAFEGVAAAFLNGLAPSSTGANNARIASGGALVDGKPYQSDANVDTVIPSAVGGGNTRIDRIVLRADWTAQTVRVTKIAGTDAASPAAPAITQTPGTTYDIKLCQVLVNTVGAITITDERTLATATAAQIANRTRNFLVTPTGGYDTTTAAPLKTDTSPYGLAMLDGDTSAIVHAFYVPADFAGSLNLKMIVTSQFSGNLYCSGRTILLQAAGVAIPTFNESDTPGALAITASQIMAVGSITLVNPAAGQYILVQCNFARANALDTVNGNVVYFVGLLVSYTADS